MDGKISTLFFHKKLPDPLRAIVPSFFSVETGIPGKRLLFPLYCEHNPRKLDEFDLRLGLFILITISLKYICIYSLPSTL